MTKTIKHPYFGELNPDYVVDLCSWEFSFSFEGEEIDVVLWESEEGKGISEEMLDFFADFLQDFANKSRIAREMLKEV